MGIGNHDAHHRHPGNSWLTMALALWRRPKETGPLRTLAGMLLDPTYRRYGARH